MPINWRVDTGNRFDELDQRPCKAGIWGAVNNGVIERESDGEQLAVLQLAAHEPRHGHRSTHRDPEDGQRNLEWPTFRC